MKVWMLVTSGYYDDLRVQKAARSASCIDGVASVTVLATKRGETDLTGSRPSSRNVSVLLAPGTTSQFSSVIKKLPARVAFLVWAAWQTIRRSEPGDIVHCHDLDTSAVGVLASFVGRNYISDFHEVYSGRASVRRWSQKAYRLLERLALRRAQGAIFVSEAARDYFEQTSSLPKSAVITNSRPLDEVILRSDLKDVSKIVYVGRFSAQRGLIPAIQAMSLLPERFKLDMIGFGSLIPEMKHAIATLGLDEQVRILAPVSLDDVVKTIHDYQIGLVLTELTCDNHRLTVSNKLFEYAAAGTPTVMSAAEEHLRIREEYAIGEICSVVPHCIADAIERLANEPDKYKRAVADSYRLAVDRCWERESTQYQGLYFSSR